MRQLNAKLFLPTGLRPCGPSRGRSQRRGTTIVETAVVMPIFFLLVFFIFEFGHAMMVSNVLKNAARTSARWGSVGTTPTEDVREYALARIGGAVRSDRVQIMIKDASGLDNGGTPPRTLQDFEDMPDVELATADRQQMFMVRAIVRYGDIALVPNPWLQDVWVGGQTFTRHE